MTITQVLAVIIFVAMFGLIISEKIERHWVSLGSALAMLVIVFGICMRSGEAVWETLAVANIFKPGFWISQETEPTPLSGINWATIIFIASMMLMVEGMGKSGFFRWMCLRIARAVKYKPRAILVTFMIMSAGLSMFIDSITVILFLAAVTVEIAHLLHFDPIPLILSEIFCANLGGTATMSGNPPNIIVGTSLHYTFMDFLTNSGPIVGITLVLIIAFFFVVFRKRLPAEPAIDTTVPMSEEQANELDPRRAIKSKRDFAISCAIFAVAVILLVTHATTGLTVTSVGAIVCVMTLAAFGKRSIELIKALDYKTLLFFTGLFVVVTGLEKTGVLVSIASLIGKIAGGNLAVTIAIIVWICEIASAFVDNIPFAATMIPVIKSLAASGGLDLSVLTWATIIGTNIGGNATPIGASANVVGISLAAKNGHFITWKEYCKYAAPATILVILISMILMFVRYL